jgi:hypothetical protein
MLLPAAAAALMMEVPAGTVTLAPSISTLTRASLGLAGVPWSL